MARPIKKYKKGGEVSARKKRRRARKNPLQSMKSKAAKPLESGVTSAKEDKAFKSGVAHAKAKQDFRKAYGQKDNPETRRANVIETMQLVEDHQRAARKKK